MASAVLCMAVASMSSICICLAGARVQHVAWLLEVEYGCAGLSPVNVGRMLMRGSLTAFKPCPALACIELLQRSNLPIRNKKVCPLVVLLAHCMLAVQPACVGGGGSGSSTSSETGRSQKRFPRFCWAA